MLSIVILLLLATFSESGPKSIRGVAKPDGVFHDATRKVVKLREMLEFHKNPHFASRESKIPRKAWNLVDSHLRLIAIPHE